MTYGEMKDSVLQLLGRYSVAGEPVALSYNDQGDLTARIPGLVRDALYYIATTARRLRTVAPLTAPAKLGNGLCFDLPADCYQLAAGLLLVGRDGQIHRCRDYRLLGGKQVLVPAEPGQWLAEYFRYPAVPAAAPSENEVLDCPPEAEAAVACYVAAHLAMEDDRYLHGALYNEFERKLAWLQEGPVLESGVTEDVYG